MRIDKRSGMVLCDRILMVWDGLRYLHQVWQDHCYVRRSGLVWGTGVVILSSEVDQ